MQSFSDLSPCWLGSLPCKKRMPLSEPAKHWMPNRCFIVSLSITSPSWRISCLKDRFSSNAKVQNGRIQIWILWELRKYSTQTMMEWLFFVHLCVSGTASQTFSFFKCHLPVLTWLVKFPTAAVHFILVSNSEGNVWKNLFFVVLINGGLVIFSCFLCCLYFSSHLLCFL